MGLTEGQQRCVDTLDRPLVVAAGAGSGKTFTLTKRIVSALTSGYLSDIDEVCAITFTKKAAAELKSRLKAELRACGFVEQALKVDEAWVSTIHGMCARILRAHAIELGIDPSFSVAEGVQVQAYLDQAIDAVLVSAQCGGSSQQLDALFAEYPARSFGGRGTSVEGMLAELVEKASAQANGMESFVMPGVTVSPRYAVESVVEEVGAIYAMALDMKPSAKRDEWLASTEEQLERARAALEGGLSDPVDALALIGAFKLAKTFGGKDFKARVDEAKGVVGAFTMEVRLGAAAAHLETLVELARQVLSEFCRLKRDNGALDNNDLLVQAARALEEHPDIAARYADKFKLVMVDEFQDTDQMQVDMIKRLAGEGARRLCTVGDAQQSIYRFRGADVSVYRRHLEFVRANWDDSVIELSQNFRSHADVLSFVDKVFEQPSMLGGEFMSLSAGRDEGRVAAPFEPSRNRVLVQHTSRPWRGVSGAEACRVAARRIADEFAQLAAAGHSPGEMVVLLGRMTNAGVYARALRDAGLACVISGGSVFAQTPEAHIVRELVRAIANPSETQSLFNVLTSPVFALTAGDLLQVGGCEGFEKASRSPEQDAGGYSPQLACALRVMGAAWRASEEDVVSRVVERIALESGWLTRLEREGAEGLASAGNVYKAIRIIREAERNGAFGPVSVMRAFEDALAGSKEAPGALSVSGGNSVRIMTIHASKGLEFPVVAVAEVSEDTASLPRLATASLGGSVYLSLDLHQTARALGDNVSLDDVSRYVLGDIAGEDEFARAVTEEAGALQRRLALRGYCAAGDEEEARRLLYVAITRAKEAVIVSSCGKRTKDNPLGVPKSALAGVFSALDPAGAVIGDGVSTLEYGGSLPALVECIGLEADGVDVPGGGASGGGALQGEASEDGTVKGPLERKAFVVPASEPEVAICRETFKPLREGVFSYSSISDASHGSDALVRLADAYAVSVDEGLPAERLGAVADGQGFAEHALACSAGASASLVEEGLANVQSGRAARKAGALVSVEEEPAWGAEGGVRPFDEDRATDLGTAFHRLAQYGVVTRGAVGGALVAPPEERVRALCRTCNVTGGQRERLDAALGRWFGSALAREMASMPNLQAEVPFFIAVTRAGEQDVFLEGEVDLLGFDEGGRHAHVVDYKTGGFAGESAESLREKHVLQAACYAYAVLLQGAESVDADFVRVERGRADDPTQPQCVRYRFTVNDVAQLERAIAEAYAQASA